VVIGSQEYQEKYGFHEEETGSIITFQYLVCAIFLPVLGYVSDKYGSRSTILIAGGYLSLFSHILQLLLPDCLECWYSIIPIFNYGLIQTVYFVVMWGSLSFLVEPQYIGSAYGVLSCI
jgi:MFS family permease